MRKAFDFEGPVFVFLSKMADLIWLNCLFLICSIPIFTMGASFTAMYYVTLKMARDEEGYVTKSFFKSFKQNFLQATAIWIILIVVGFIISVDYRIVASDSLENVAANGALKNIILIGATIVTIFMAFIFVYVFPILAKFENSVKNTIKNAFFMSLKHLPFTVIMIVIPIIPVVMMYFNPTFYLLVFIMFSLVALISSTMLVKIFDNYIPKETVGGNDEEEKQ